MLVQKASVLVVTPTQFGDGNLRNLDAAQTALEQGIPTVLLDDGPIAERDFTAGKATKYLEKLRQNGAVTVKNISELISFLNNLETKNNKSSST